MTDYNNLLYKFVSSSLEVPQRAFLKMKTVIFQRKNYFLNERRPISLFISDSCFAQIYDFLLGNLLSVCLERKRDEYGGEPSEKWS